MYNIKNYKQFLFQFKMSQKFSKNESQMNQSIKKSEMNQSDEGEMELIQNFSPSIYDQDDSFSSVSLQEHCMEPQEAVVNSMNQYAIATIGSRECYYKISKKNLKKQHVNSKPTNQKNLTKILKANSILKSKEKIKLIKELKKHSLLKHTLNKLNLIFIEQTFDEIIFIVYHLLESYLKYKATFEIENLFPFLQMPALTDFDNIDNQFCQSYIKSKKQQKNYDPISEEQLYKAADIAAVMFQQKSQNKQKLPYLSFSKHKIIENADLDSNFTQFLKVLARTVFGSCEEMFQHPNFQPVNCFQRKWSSSNHLASFNQDVDENTKAIFYSIYQI